MGADLATSPFGDRARPTDTNTLTSANSHTTRTATIPNLIRDEEILGSGPPSRWDRNTGVVRRQVFWPDRELRLTLPPVIQHDRSFDHRPDWRARVGAGRADVM